MREFLIGHYEFFIESAIAIIILVLTVGSERRARRAERRQASERIPSVSAKISGDRPAITVSITNIGLTDFTIFRIFLDSGKRLVNVGGNIFEFLDGDKLPKTLKHGTSAYFRVPYETLDRIPVDVKPRVVLEIGNGEKIRCRMD